MQARLLPTLVWIVLLALAVLCMIHLSITPAQPSSTSEPPNLASDTTTTTMSWFQKTFTLPPRSRGCYLISDHVASELPELRNYKVGLLHLFVQHTSCGLSLNENWDDDVRADMSDALDRLAPEDRKGNLYRHAAEGEDDMPVFHSLLRILIPAPVSIPIPTA